MSSSTSVAVPAGYSPPFAVVTPDDHAASILIATAFGLACFLFFAGIRTAVRTTISHGVGLDDYLLYTATGLAVVQSGLILGACSKGLGKALPLVSGDAQHTIQRMYYASNLLFIIVLGLAKISLVAFLLRISRMKQHRRVFNAAMAVLAAWTLAAVLALALQCDLSHPWLFVRQQCPGVARRWQAIGALDMVTEVAIIAAVGYLVHDLQTSVRSKLTVLSIFSVRLLLIVFIAFRLHTFDAHGYTTNPLLREANFIAWTQSEMAYALMSATIPVFHNFLKSLSTGFGGGMQGMGHGYGYGSGTHSHMAGQKATGYQLAYLKSPHDRAPMASTNDESGEELGPAAASIADRRGGAPAVSTTGPWPDRRGSTRETPSIHSEESQRYMIKKDVEWEVRTERRD